MTCSSSMMNEKPKSRAFGAMLLETASWFGLKLMTSGFSWAVITALHVALHRSRSDANGDMPSRPFEETCFLACANGPQILFEVYSLLNLVRNANEQPMRQHRFFSSFFLLCVGGISAEEFLVRSASWACKPCTFCWHMAMTLLMKHVLHRQEKRVTNIYLAQPFHMHCVN